MAMAMATAMVMAMGDGDGGVLVLEFSCRCLLNPCAEGPMPLTATEPLPRDGGMRGWCMARPMYVARVRCDS
eukprot:scaffold73103_cov32-Tisochrysis_lutea.AAC.3